LLAFNKPDNILPLNYVFYFIISQALYCVVILYMFRASSVHLQEALH
jgi:hypothetical protein